VYAGLYVFSMLKCSYFFLDGHHELYVVFNYMYWKTT